MTRKSRVSGFVYILYPPIQKIVFCMYQPEIEFPEESLAMFLPENV